MKYEKCPQCGGEWAGRTISCPDKKPGCLVLHQEYYCYACKASKAELMDKDAMEDALRSTLTTLAAPKVTAEVIVEEHFVERRVVRVEVENGPANEWIRNAREAALRGEGEVLATKRHRNIERISSTTMVGPGINKPWEQRTWDHDRL